ncbi:MAG TPA: MoaD/ThiS family protein [Candidatus Rubrimentiphilum sp.]|nr:MoaD/ThiS family protein [Candidatus Rubrimentiphilum sp.]
MIRVVLPAHLRTLAHITGEMQLDLNGRATQRSVLDAIEARYPMLSGTMRDSVTHKRRPFIRFFACEKDLSHDPPDTPLPDAVVQGSEPFLIVGAIAGG